MSDTLALVSGPSVPSIFTTTPKADYLTGQFVAGNPYPVFNDSIEDRQKSFDNGFFIYVQPRTYRSLADKTDDTWSRLQCACERIFLMEHTSTEWVQIMGKHFISQEDIEYIAARLNPKAAL